jgi:hypothetical protein
MTTDLKFEDRLLDQLLEVHAELNAARPIAISRNGRRRSLKFVGVAAMAAAVAVVVPQVLPGGIGKVDPAAAAEFHRLAVRASAATPVAAPTPGQFLYTDSVGTTSVTSVYDAHHFFNADYQIHRQIWIGSDGSGRLKESASHVTFPTTKDYDTWVASGKPNIVGGQSDEMFGRGGLSTGPVNLWTLTTDPTKLAAEISSRQIESGPAGPAEDFVQVGDLLRETDAPPALRAALFEVASQIPGVVLVGSVSTPTGQHGTALAFVKGTSGDWQERDELVFDPTTSALVATEDLSFNTATGASKLITWTSYLTSVVVDSTSATH